MREALVEEDVDAVVVRELVGTDQAAAICEFVPEDGKQRVYTRPWLFRHPAFQVPHLREARERINRMVIAELGRTATIFGAYVMRPDMLRAGPTRLHCDGRGTILSGSLNLDMGSEDETAFFARRVTPSNAPFSQIMAAERQSMPYAEMARCTLGIGDMIFVARGVLHGSEASEDRQSITYRTRGIIPADFR